MRKFLAGLALVAAVLGVPAASANAQNLHSANNLFAAAAANQTQTIPLTRLSGSQVFNFNATTSVFTDATVSIDRTVNQGLNSLTSADTLFLSIDYSLDSGATWRNIAGITMVGGLIVVKGFEFDTEILDVGTGTPFPVGTLFRVNTVASTPVRIAGTIVYS